jgi:hypothetical protein
MLIDSYPVQQAVIASDLPGAMLKDLDELGVTGIAVLADGLRKPIGVDGPLLSPAEFNGITFQAFRSELSAEAIRALGATPTDTLAITEAIQSGELDGYEKSLRIQLLNGASVFAPYVTANVNLWANPAAIIGNPESLAALEDDQRQWLMQAGADAAEASTDLVDDDTEQMLALCGSGARFADASDSDLEALRQSFQPVYDELRQDAQTAEFIDQIEALKAATEPGPELAVPPDCTGPADPDLLAAAPRATDDSSFDAADRALEGTYRWPLTEQDGLAQGLWANVSSEELAWLPAVATMTLADGTWELSWQGADGSVWVDGPATYDVDGNELVFYWPQDPLGSLSFTFVVDDDGVKLEPVPPMDPDSRFVWSFNTWERIDGESANADDQGVLNGVYRYELTDEELQELGRSDPADIAENHGVFTWTLSDGTWEVDQIGEGVSDHGEGTYEVAGDSVSFTAEGIGTFEFTWERDADGSIRLTPNAGDDPAVSAALAFNVWERID